MSPINSDLSGLPQGDKAEGFPPVAEPLIVDRLAQAWFDAYLERGEDKLEMAVEGARWRASWSGMCARAVGYNVGHADDQRLLARMAAEEATEPVLHAQSMIVAGSAPTDPPGIADFWRWGIGTMTHEAIQKVVVDAFPGAEAEVKIKVDSFGAAHADLVIDEPTADGGNFRTVVEIKTIAGFGWKVASTGWKGPAEGPRRTAIVQGAVAAVALGADRMIVAYLSLENLSPKIAEQHGRDEIGRFSGEWWFERDEFEAIAAEETRRVRKIIALVDEGKLPPRHVPGEMPTGARITRPEKSAWTLEQDGAIIRAGELWNGQFCQYCSFRSRCIGDGPS